jgi:cytochrome c
MFFSPGPSNAGASGSAGSGGNPSCTSSIRTFDSSQGQATAIVFASSYELAVQEREPAAITFIDTRTGEISAYLNLKQATRFDTGHTMFHVRASAGVACASCHSEAGDDGHVWTFHGIGARRTQSLRGGILGTEPFHWNGDMKDFSTLVTEVFVGRMGGFAPTDDQRAALSHWIDRQPSLAAQPSDASAAARGKQLFESAAVGCTSCHSGAHLTNNAYADVGTGARLQVPSLHGVSFRTPLMHNGCAATLADRFSSTCGGGDQHGHTSQLSPTQIGDLTEYLGTL